MKQEVNWTVFEAEETCGNTSLGIVFLVMDGPRTICRFTERKDAEVFLNLLTHYNSSIQNENKNHH